MKQILRKRDMFKNPAYWVMLSVVFLLTFYGSLLDFQDCIEGLGLYAAFAAEDAAQGIDYQCTYTYGDLFMFLPIDFFSKSLIPTLIFFIIWCFYIKSKNG